MSETNPPYPTDQAGGGLPPAAPPQAGPPGPPQGAGAAPPPAYPAPAQMAPPQADSAWVLSYVDFTPVCLAEGGFMNMAQYELFPALMVKANQWLQQNPGLKVKVCESLEVKASHYGSGVDTNSPLYWESGKYSSYYIRCLRCWIVPKGPNDNPAPQQLGYLNVIPACLQEGGFMSMPVFEGYGQTIIRLNQILQEQPIQGRILNVETQDIKFESWGGSVNPDITFWRESGKYSTYFLNIIRVFYEAGPPCYEQIGSVDFVPSRVSQGGMFQMGMFDPLSVVLGRANEWMQQNPGLPLVNIQSLDYKLNNNWGGEQLDTQRTIFRESGKYATYYVRILRAYYSHSATGAFPRPPVACLSYKTFLPCQLTMGGMFSMPQYESQTQTMQRAMAWLKATNAKVIGCETVPVKMFGQHGADSERTYTYNSGRYAEHYLFIIRVFLDGYYQEPPPELLPPLPQIVQTSSDTGCCALQ